MRTDAPGLLEAAWWRGGAKMTRRWQRRGGAGVKTAECHGGGGPGLGSHRRVGDPPSDSTSWIGRLKLSRRCWPLTRVVCSKKLLSRRNQSENSLCQIMPRAFTQLEIGPNTIQDPEISLRKLREADL